MSYLKAIFEDIADRNAWDGDESRSGPGSALSYTLNLRSQLLVAFEMFDIRKIFDAPCGDFNWMRAVKFSNGIEYIGGDIVESLVNKNKEKYSGPNISFINFDIATSRFPVADMWFCRDCLFHLPDEFIFQALRNFCNSDIKLLMMTNHLNTTGFKNTDIKAGDFRLVDFYLEPFGLPTDVLFRVADYVYPYPQREMCVWTREQVASALDKCDK